MIMLDKNMRFEANSLTRNWLEKSRDAWENFGINQFNIMFDESTYRGKLQAEELRWVISHIPADAYKILDAGCGPGRYSQILMRDEFEVVSYDFSRNILGLFRKNFRQLSLLDPILVQGDIQALPFKNNQFDIVFMLDVLHHLETKHMRMNAIKESFRVSNKYIFLDIKNKYNPYLWYRYKTTTDPFLRTAYTHSEIIDIVQKLGGDITKKHGIGFPIMHVAPYILIEAVKRR